MKGKQIRRKKVGSSGGIMVRTAALQLIMYYAYFVIVQGLRPGLAPTKMALLKGKCICIVKMEILLQCPLVV